MLRLRQGGTATDELQPCRQRTHPLVCSVLRGAQQRSSPVVNGSTLLLVDIGRDGLRCATRSRPDWLFGRARLMTWPIPQRYSPVHTCGKHIQRLASCAWPSLHGAFDGAISIGPSFKCWAYAHFLNMRPPPSGGTCSYSEVRCTCPASLLLPSSPHVPALPGPGQCHTHLLPTASDRCASLGLWQSRLPGFSHGCNHHYTDCCDSW